MQMRIRQVLSRSHAAIVAMPLATVEFQKGEHLGTRSGMNAEEVESNLRIEARLQGHNALNHLQLTVCGESFPSHLWGNLRRAPLGHPVAKFASWIQRTGRAHWKM